MDNKKEILRAKVVQGLEFFGPLTVKELRFRLTSIEIYPKEGQLEEAVSELQAESLIENHGSYAGQAPVYRSILI